MEHLERVEKGNRETKLSFQFLPTLNAILNSITAVLLLTGYGLIRKGHRKIHQMVMISALGCSVVFLTSYLIYHYHAGTTRFMGQGVIRPVYFTMLLTHTLLAAMVPPLAIITVIRAAKGNFEKHRRLARWTLPIWLYVSVTGVVIYWLLYHVYPAR